VPSSAYVGRRQRMHVTTRDVDNDGGVLRIFLAAAADDGERGTGGGGWWRRSRALCGCGGGGWRRRGNEAAAGGLSLDELC
jgi:hypothetical protein